MSPAKTVAPIAESGTSDDVLSSFVAAVEEDPRAVVTAVRTRVAASQSDANNCMMGGWTA